MNIEIKGQIRGGKNNMIVLRNGMHIPKKEWARWRDEVVEQLKGQAGDVMDKPAIVTIRYRAGDARRRDIPAVVDSIFHCLERAGVVKDDALLEDMHFFKRLDRVNPGAEIEIVPKAVPAESYGGSI